MTAASSGSAKPMTTSSRVTGCKRLTTRDKTVLPTLAPQPPQRMAMAEISCNVCLSAIALLNCGALSCVISGSTLKLSIKRRSIQSLTFHNQAPSNDQLLREAMAYLSPVLMRPRKFFCGVNFFNGLFNTARSRLRASGGPWRTANTPDFSRG